MNIRDSRFQYITPSDELLATLIIYAKHKRHMYHDDYIALKNMIKQLRTNRCNTIPKKVLRSMQIKFAIIQKVNQR